VLFYLVYFFIFWKKCFVASFAVQGRRTAGNYKTLASEFRGNNDRKWGFRCQFRDSLCWNCLVLIEWINTPCLPASSFTIQSVVTRLWSLCCNAVNQLTTLNNLQTSTNVEVNPSHILLVGPAFNVQCNWCLFIHFYGNIGNWFWKCWWMWMDTRRCKCTNRPAEELWRGNLIIEWDEGRYGR